MPFDDKLHSLFGFLLIVIIAFMVLAAIVSILG